MENEAEDIETRLRAIEGNLEYWRASRLEPCIFLLARRGILYLHEIVKVRPSDDLMEKRSDAKHSTPDISGRIKELEKSLEEYIREVNLFEYCYIGTPQVPVVIEELRKEAGIYSEPIAKKKRHGSIEEQIHELENDLRDYMTFLKLVMDALFRKGYASKEDLREGRQAIAKLSPWNGARVVARAWVDPEFKARLLEKGWEAIRELGIPPSAVGKLKVVENKEEIHNVIVCTLCSCYPYDFLGDSPWWYKDDSYKKRIVANPRDTLEEMFGLKIPSSRQIRVHDSTSDVRYLVLPRRPSNTQGMSEDQLAKLVTRDSLIGSGEPSQAN